LVHISDVRAVLLYISMIYVKTYFPPIGLLFAD
jgi:hypothetical protein